MCAGYIYYVSVIVYFNRYAYYNHRASPTFEQQDIANGLCIIDRRLIVLMISYISFNEPRHKSVCLPHCKQEYFLFCRSFVCFRFVSDENGSLFTTISEDPIPLKEYIKFCEQRRKFPVLYKLEFQVSVINSTGVRSLCCNALIFYRWPLKHNNTVAAMQRGKSIWRRTKTKNAFLVSIFTFIGLLMPW